VVDRRSHPGDLETAAPGLPASEVDIALGIDAERGRALFLETVARDG
jgi:hypothetical protein